MDRSSGGLLARGRMADVFDAGTGLVLRRYRDPGLNATLEATAMTYLHEVGYPVPRVESRSPEPSIGAFG